MLHPIPDASLPQPGQGNDSRRSITAIEGHAVPAGAFVAFEPVELGLAILRSSGQIGTWLAEIPTNEPAPVVLTILSGGRFYSERLQALLRTAEVRFEVAEVRASSYGSDGSRSDQIIVDGEFSALAGRRVLLCDDVLDSGRTIASLRKMLAEAGAQDVKAAVLVDKVHPSITKGAAADFTATTFFGAEWLGGAGMDAVGVPDEIARRQPFIIAHPAPMH